jgi:hypothetical protein
MPPNYQEIQGHQDKEPPTTTMSHMVKQSIKKEIAHSRVKLCDEDKEGVKHYINSQLKNTITDERLSCILSKDEIIIDIYESTIKSHLASLDNNHINALTTGWKSEIEIQLESNTETLSSQAAKISDLTALSNAARIQSETSANVISQQAEIIEKLQEQLSNAISRITSVESRCDSSTSIVNDICHSNN